MYKENRLKGLVQWKNATICANLSDHSLAKYALELCQFAMEKHGMTEELAALTNEGTEEGQLIIIARNVHTRAFREMWTLEGSDWEVEEQVNSTKGSQGKQPTYGAVGARVRTYKSAFSMDDLRDRPREDEQEGTPPGNRSIRQMLQRN